MNSTHCPVVGDDCHNSQEHEVEWKEHPRDGKFRVKGHFVVFQHDNTQGRINGDIKEKRDSRCLPRTFFHKKSVAP